MKQNLAMRGHANFRFSSIVAVTVSACAVVVMCAFIFFMSSLPADDSTELSMGVVWHIIGFIVPGYDQMTLAEQLQWQQALDHPVRKVAHFLEYALLGALMMNLVFQVARFRDGASENRSDCAKSSISSALHPLVVAAWAMATAYAITDEVHQIFVPGRACMVTDVLIDAAGVLLGAMAVALIIRAYHKAASTRQS